MSKDLVADIAEMHKHYGVNEKVREFDSEKLKAFIEFRGNFLKEELTEYFEATNISGSVYKLYKSAEGMSGYMTQMWEAFQKELLEDRVSKLVLKEI